jgi:Zn-dependent protease with chaperone function
MNKFIAALVFAFTANFAAANPMVAALKAEDESRLCPAAEVSKETRLLKREAAYVLETMGLPKDSITVLVATCGDYAVAATSLNTIIISPSLAELPRGERLFLLAHEVGHLANGDVKRLLALGDELAASAEALANVDKLMATLSRENETAADLFAAKFMQKVGVNAESAASAFFARMGLLQLPGTASHPAAQSRVAAIALASNN